MVYKDCNGKSILRGQVVRHGNTTGIVRWDEYEGHYIDLKNGKKLRVSDYHSRLTVIKRKLSRRPKQVRGLNENS